MKKQIAILLILTLLTACASGSATPTQGIEVGDGEFLITPDDFIARWNEGVQKLKEKNPDDKDIQHLVGMPDYAGNGQEANWIDNSLKIILEENDKGNLISVSVYHFSLSPSLESSHNFGFFCGAVARFFKPETDFNIDQELGLLSSGTGIKTAFDEDISYQYNVAYGLGHIITITPKWN